MCEPYTVGAMAEFRPQQHAQKRNKAYEHDQNQRWNGDLLALESMPFVEFRNL
jgi:hypothetical protein